MIIEVDSSSLHSADATFVLLTCNLSVTMLIVLSLCESNFTSTCPVPCRKPVVYILCTDSWPSTNMLYRALSRSPSASVGAEQGGTHRASPHITDLSTCAHSLGCTCDQYNQFAPVWASHEWQRARASDRLTPPLHSLTRVHHHPHWPQAVYERWTLWHPVVPGLVKPNCYHVAPCWSFSIWPRRVGR